MSAVSEIVLVRHGQASFGTDDYDRLSALGQEQATWLGEYMLAHDICADRVVHGGLRRQRETAEGILSVIGDHPREVDPRVDEFHYFELEQEYVRNTGADAATCRADFLTLFPRIYVEWADGRITGGGESFPAFEARVSAVLDQAIARGGTTLVVTSGGVIGMALRRVLGLGTRATAEVLLNIHNASVHRLEWEGGRLGLSLFNASPHLDPADRVHARTYV